MESQDLAFDLAPIGFATIDSNGVILRANRTLEGLLGAGETTLIGRRLDDFTRADEGGARFDSLLRELPAGVAAHKHIDRLLVGADGRELWARVSVTPTSVAADGPATFLVTLQELTAEREREAELRLQLASLEELWRSASSAIAILRSDGEIVRAYPGFTGLFGYPEAEAVGRRIQDLLGADGIRPDIERNLLSATQGRTISAEGVRRHRDGHLIHVSVLGRAFQINTRETGVFVIYRDITERVQAEAIIQRLSTTDELTGLWNRRGFNALAEQAVLRAVREREGLIVIYADLDDFKAINDRFGHVEGDRALAEVAYLLRSSSRGSDIVARFGGDEFVILAAGVRDGERVLTERILSAIDARNASSSRPFRLELSIGAAYVQPDESNLDLDAVIATADQRMYAEKARRAASRVAEPLPDVRSGPYPPS